MAESRPHIAAHDLLSAGLVTASTIPETTPALDAIIESDEAPTIQNSPADGSRPSTPSSVPPKSYCEESFAPDLASFQRSMVHHHEKAIMLSQRMLSPIEEMGSGGGSKRKRADDCESDGSQSK